MKNQERWVPTKYELFRGRLRGSRDARELGVGSRLISDLVASLYDKHLSRHASGRLLDLGCGTAPFFGAYAPYVTEIMGIDWAAGEYVDLQCDLSQPLPIEDRRFDTIILSDVLEHIPEPDLLWREMARVLAPEGKLILNVPFYYSVHAHPHDFYRYTNFALERFMEENGMEKLKLEAVGGIVEIYADLTAKLLSKAGPIGRSLASLIQMLAFRFSRTRFGTRVMRRSSRHFPLGYFLVAQRVG
jgi:SAM-dependent methyltransferase